MKINEYGRELLPAEIQQREHRDFVGGLWDEVGQLQLDFMQSRGLMAGDRLLDVGCGALRGGVHFVRYLAPGHYHGMDLNASLIEAGKRELAEAGLADRMPSLLVDDKFEVFRFGVTFPFAIAVSVFTHLPMNHIVRCLVEVGAVLAAGGRFFASYFQAPTSAHLPTIVHPPAQIVTSYDADPYHYSFAEMEWMAGNAGLAVDNIGYWRHPRGQHMLAFTRAG